MKLLVTGGSGFVGSNLLQMLASSGHHVVCPVRRLPATSAAPNIEFVAIPDLATGAGWRRALPGCEVVIHLAGRAHVLREQASDPAAEFRRINVDATATLARQAAEHGVRRFIFISSIKVNGERTGTHPFAADDKPLPEDAYGRSKLDAESVLRELAAQHAMEWVIVRPPLIYGPGVKANFARLMQAVQRGLPLPLGAIDNRRSLLYVGNLTDLLCRCIDHPQAANRVFLASDNEDLSTPELIRRLATAMQVTPRLLPVPPALLLAAATLAGKRLQAEKLLGSLQLDISQTMRLLDWRPPHSVDAALQATVRSINFH